MPKYLLSTDRVYSFPPIGGFPPILWEANVREGLQCPGRVKDSRVAEKITCKKQRFFCPFILLTFLQKTPLQYCPKPCKSKNQRLSYCTWIQCSMRAGRMTTIALQKGVKIVIKPSYCQALCLTTSKTILKFSVWFGMTVPTLIDHSHA